MSAVGLLPNLDLKRKRKVPEVQEVEEGEMVPSKRAKQPKNIKDKRAPKAAHLRSRIRDGSFKRSPVMLKCTEGRALKPFS